MKKKDQNKKLKLSLKVKSNVKAGPTRRLELDKVGMYNFVVEIEGISVG